ncbi:MAG: peptidoglycan DD-metalloendopeptidase family protein [Chloroflexota bacterium]|nr:peptidoglycan DD-metalloendopeptidase family protein [Chloroflexota bacterium]
MPDLRRRYRRFTESHLPTRVIAHLSVVSLVIVASAAGIAQAQGSGSNATTSTRVETGFPSIVSAARGAAADSPAPTPSVYTMTSLSAGDLPPVDRGARAQVPTSEPLPTPVALDPDATPLPAPSAVGEVATGTGPTSRGAAVPAPVAPAPVAPRFVFPVPGGSYSQGFHAGHLAVDIAAPYGAQIVAAQAGVVTSGGWRNNGGGNVISIDHGNGIVTVYNHLGSIWVSPGQYVAAGQGIGGVGCTGLCTGPHVHFEVFVNGMIDNPQRYL